MVQGAVQARHPHIVQPQHFVAVDLRRQGGLLRYGDIAGAAGSDNDAADAVRLRHSADDAAAGILVIVQRVCGGDLLSRLRRQAGDENGPLAPPAHDADDADHLGRSLSRAVDHLRRALADAAVQVHFCIADVGEGLLFQGQQRVIHGHGPLAYALQHFADLAVHALASRSSHTAS